MEKITLVEEVLRRYGEERTSLKEIMKIKGNWLWHVMRGTGKVTLALEESVKEWRRGGEED